MCAAKDGCDYGQRLRWDVERHPFVWDERGTSIAAGLLNLTDTERRILAIDLTLAVHEGRPEVRCRAFTIHICVENAQLHGDVGRIGTLHAIRRSLAA